MNAHVLYQDTRSIRTFSDFSALAEVYGAKAAGLMLIPVAWCPAFVGIPTLIHRDWRQGRPFDLTIAVEVERWLEATRANSPSGFILRSSGVHESIGHRGRHLSIRLDETADVQKIQAQAAAI